MVETGDESKSKGLLFGIHGDNLSNFESDDGQSMYSQNTSIRKLDDSSRGSLSYASKLSSSQ